MDSTMLNAALAYVAEGFRVFPVKPDKKPLTKHGLKDATQLQIGVKEYWSRWPNAGIGLVTDGFVVVDFDAKNGGVESKSAIEAKYGQFPRTRTHRTGGGGLHNIYRNLNGTDVRNAVTLGGYQGVDLRANGGYIVAPPSLHESGKRYEVIDKSEIAPAPAWLVELATKNQMTQPRAMPEGQPLPEGQRNATLASLAGTMRRRGMSKDAILAGLLAENEARCIPPLPDEDVQRIAESVSRYEPAPSSIDSGAQSKPAPPWPEPLAEEAFYGLAGEVVRAIEPHTEGDPAALLLNFLTFFGNTIGRGPHAVAEADRHGCNLNIVQVGETSKGRKGSAWGHVRKPFHEVGPAWTEQRIASGLSSGEGLIWAVRDRIEKVVKGESTIVDAGVEDKRLFVIETEFASPLRVMSREGNTLSATIRQAWDSGTLRILTRNSPAVATGAHISIAAHVTKAELLRYLNDIEAGNGFANRFLWVCVKRSKILPEGGGQPSYDSITKRLHDTLEKARNLGELRRDTEAKRIWADIYPELSEGKPGLFGAVTARAEAQVLRLSLIYAALDGDSEIRPAHLLAALAIWDYCEASARYIFGDALGDSVADRIQAMLRQSPEGLSRTSIYQLFSKHTSAARIEQALGLLQTTGRARCEIKETAGRPLEVWRTA